MISIEKYQTDPFVAILLVLYNEEQHIPRLINSIKNQTCKDFDIYAIETSECGDSSKRLIELYPSANLFPYQGNLGFAAGNNYLAEKAFQDGADFLFVLNTDMELSPNTLEVFISYFSKIKNLGVISAALFDGKSNVLQLFGYKVNFSTQNKKKYFQQMKITEENLPDELEVDMVNGGSTFLSREVYEKIGLWEERYFMYNDEIELALRMKNSGYKTIVTSKTEIKHHHDWQPENKNSYFLMYYYITRNRYLYFHYHNLYFNMIKDLLIKTINTPLTIRWLFRLAGLRLVKYYYVGVFHGIMGYSGISKIDFNA